MPIVWIHLGLPALLWVVLYLTESRSIRGDVQRAENQFRRARIRQLEALEEDRVLIAGKVVSPEGGLVSLGSSTEKPDEIRHNPVLDGESFMIETEDGRRFRIRSGKIRIERLPGAERKLVRTLTTESGVEQTYSFEVPEGFELMVVGRRTGGASGAFRGGPIDLEPLDGGYRVGTKLFDDTKTPTLRKVDTAKNVSLVGALFAMAAAGLGYVPYVGAFLWYPAMVIMAMTVFVFLFGNSAVEPLRAEEEAKLEALKVRVAIPEQEQRDAAVDARAEVEDVAAEAEA